MKKLPTVEKIKYVVRWEIKTKVQGHEAELIPDIHILSISIQTRNIILGTTVHRSRYLSADCIRERMPHRLITLLKIELVRASQ